MAAPTNISAASATDLGTLPASVTQNVHDAGTTYTVWYRYTATVDDVIVGVFGYGDASVYRPGVKVFNDVGATPSDQIISTGSGANGNRAVQFAVTPGTTYYIQFAPPAGDPSPAVLTIEAESFGQAVASSGFIAVPDDTLGFPLVLIDIATGEVVRFVNPFPSSECGDILDDGTMCMYDLTAQTLNIYDTQFNLIISVPSVVSSSFGGLRTCQGTQRWWFYGKPSTNHIARYITDAGVLGTAHILPAGVGIECLAASNDESVLYYCRNSATAGKIAQFDLLTDSPLSDLAGEVAGYRVFDILVLSDDSIVASYVKTTATFDFQVRRYDPSGTLLNTYNFGSDIRFPNGTMPRLAYAPDDPNSFYVWRHPNPAGTSVFENVEVSTGSILDTTTSAEYEQGVYVGASTPTPVRFGNAFSCPFWIIRADFPDSPPGGTGTIRIVKTTIPSSDTGEFEFTADGGLTPDAFSLSGGSEQVFNSVPTGDGYSVTEAPNSAYATTVTVSNGSPNTNIEVGEDETVVVTFTNSQVGTMNFDVVPIKRRWLRRSPIYTQEQKRTRWSKFVLAFQAGMGNTVEPGVDPQVFMRYSGDWGQTWSSTRQVTAGKKGQYNAQVQFWNLGVQRQMVIEIYGSDPCPVYISDAYAELEGGTD